MRRDVSFLFPLSEQEDGSDLYDVSNIIFCLLGYAEVIIKERSTLRNEYNKEGLGFPDL